MIPGSTAEFSGAQLDSHQHPLPTEQVEAIFTTGKADYIADYAARMEPVLAAEKAGWAPAAGDSLLEPLRAVFEPIMLASDEICDGIGYPVELVLGSQQVVLDFPKRTVREAIPDEKFRYGFAIPAELVRTVLRDNEPDWVNTIFLVDPVQGLAGRRLQRVPVHVLQVPHRRADRLRRRLVRRNARRRRVESPWTAGRFSGDARI